MMWTVLILESKDPNQNNGCSRKRNCKKLVLGLNTHFQNDLIPCRGVQGFKPSSENNFFKEKVNLKEVPKICAEHTGV